MKPVVIGIIAFVVSTAAATGAKVMMTKPLPAKPDSSAAADSTAADSTRKPADSTRTDTAVVASGQPVAPPVDSAPPGVNLRTDSLKAKAAPIVPAQPTQPTQPTPTKAAATPALAAAAPANDTAGEGSERRLAKVFTSMDAKQAAKVLEHMSDNDVHVILGYVGVKQAASIMAALPPERVATLSKLEIQGKR
jgi:hypothetical protein